MSPKGFSPGWGALAASPCPLPPPASSCPLGLFSPQGGTWRLPSTTADRQTGGAFRARRRGLGSETALLLVPLIVPEGPTLMTHPILWLIKVWGFPVWSLPPSSADPHPAPLSCLVDRPCPLAGFSMLCGRVLLQVEFCPPKRYVQARTSSTCEYDLTWK